MQKDNVASALPVNPETVKAQDFNYLAPAMIF